VILEFSDNIIFHFPNCALFVQEIIKHWKTRPGNNGPTMQNLPRDIIVCCQIPLVGVIGDPGKYVSGCSTGALMVIV